MKQPEFRMVPVSEIEVIWPEAQRYERDRKLARMERNFDERMLGVVHLTEKNGHKKHHPIDGQHRVEIVRRVKGEDALIPALVYDVHNAQEAATFFTGLNDFDKVGAIDRFRVRVTMEEDVAVAINDIVHGLRFRIAQAAAESGAIAAVDAVERSYRTYGAGALRAALYVIRETWHGEKHSTNGAVIEAWTKLFGLVGAQIDQARLADRLARKFRPVNLLAAGKALADVRRMKIVDALVEITLETYNGGLRSGRIKLPE